MISDLHLGAPGGRDLLRAPGPRGALCSALADVERLVLLGDVVELRHGPVPSALAAAAPVLGELAGALVPGGEVVLVPGNHDHHLLDPWLGRRAGDPVTEAGVATRALALETAVDWNAGEPLASIAGALAPARVRVAYPGVWLRGDVYATHGHFSDRHTTIPMLERVAAGVMALIVSEPDGGPARIEDYEAVLAPVYAWIHAVAQSGGPRLGSGAAGTSAGAWQTLSDSGAPVRSARGRARRRALRAVFPLLVAALNRAGIGPLHRRLTGEELRLAPLRAMAEVLERLDIDAEHLIFGHTHRAGPLSSHPAPEWRGRGGQRLLNTGCWVHEPAFLGPRPHTSPYRVGFAVRLEAHRPPELVNLLDDELHAE